MTEPANNFNTNNAKVSRLHQSTHSGVPQSHSGIIKPNTSEREFNTMSDNYSKREIDLKFEAIESQIESGFEKNDLKLDSLNQKTDLKFELLSQKIDATAKEIIKQTNSQFSALKEELLKEKIETLEREKKDKRELILWSIGTAIAILAIIIPLLQQILQKG